PAGAWHAEWEPLRDLLRLTGGAARAAAELTEGLRVHPEAMRRHLGLTRGLIAAEQLSARLTPVLGRARARDLLTRLARQAREEDVDLTELLATEPELLGIDLARAADPTEGTGAAGALTDQALERP
ncbi:3-carboxy-cis,cis-muconate cycloisomerase, partial [Streptomyces sp. SID14436]|nr:3-carboxy-cis,cis-muconate cycloisomerase [Streptomyces sp. SID14436]